MELKKYILFMALILVFIPAVSATVSVTDTIQNFEETAERYDNGEISVAQMIVLLEHHHDEKQKKMNEENFPGWNKVELENALKEYKYPYGYVMKTHDMQIFMGIYSDDGENYNWGYSVGARLFPESYYENEFEDDIKDLVNDLRNRYENGKPSASQIGKKIGQVFAAESERDTYQQCVDTVKDMSIMKELSHDELPEWFFDYHPENSRIFAASIHKKTEKECFESHNCGDTDYCIDLCKSDTPKLDLVVVCDKDASPADKEPAFDFSIQHRGYESGVDYHNIIEEVMKNVRYTDKCEPWGYDSWLYFREKLQESLNKEFFDWYVNDFLGNDMEKYLNPTSGFERLMWFFHRTSEQVSNSLQCKGQNEWPDEFEKINIDYENGNIEFHIWEELKSADHKDIDMWSTLYKYKVMGDKDMMKKLIEHQLSDKSTIAPPANEIENVKQNEKAMVLLDKIISGFGDSLDAKIMLKDREKEIVSKYITINKDIILKISSNPIKKESELDFTATLTLDDLYDFGSRMSSIDAETVYGPSWVGTKEPMMIKERIGLVFKLWNSVDIDPWTTKIKLSTKIGKIFNYLKSMEAPSAKEEKMVANLGLDVDEKGNIRPPDE